MPAHKEKAKSLGQYLKEYRNVNKMTLREVEDASQVSNAYLSQLENDKISKPSPNILFRLANVLKVDYKELMIKAGYISGDTNNRRGAAPTFAIDDLTREEEEKLLEFLAFLRSRRK